MNYVVLIYHNPEAMAVWNSMSEADRARGLRVYDELKEELSARGELVATQALADRSLSRRVSVRDGRTLVTDGPFAEVKEDLAGLFIVDCDSLERAVEIAGRIPEAGLGLVEVRPTMVYSQSEG